MTFLNGQSIAPTSQRHGFDSCWRNYSFDDEFFSTVPGLNFDMCRISTPDL